MLDKWDRAALLAALTHNLTVTVANAWRGKGGTLQRPKQLTDFHPYREDADSKLTVKADDIRVFKLIGDSMIRNKRA